MTTPTDTRTVFEAWHARAMVLADDYAIAAAEHQEEATWKSAAFENKARAALSAHLSEMPMGEPVAFVDPGSLSWLASPECVPTGYMTVGLFNTQAPDHSAPLYRHPKDTA